MANIRKTHGTQAKVKISIEAIKDYSTSSNNRSNAAITYQ
jgi:hypothetical protein